MTARNGWKSLKWGELATLEYGKALRAYDNKNGEYPVFGTNGPIGFHDSYLCGKPGIVIGRKGAYRGVHFSARPFWVIDTAFYLKPRETNFDVKWAYYQLRNFDINKIDSGSAIPSTSREAFYEIPVRFPPLATQRRIAAVLGAYDDLIENNRRRIEILEEMARRLYREWFVQFRFPGHAHVPLAESPLGKIPKCWDVKTFDGLMRTCSGFAFKSATFQPSARYKVVTIKNVQNGSFLDESDSQIDTPPSNMPDHCHLGSGDILLSLTGNIGRVCFVFGRDFLLNQRVAKLVPHQRSNRGFVYFAFRCEETQARLGMISNGVAQQNLSPVQMGKLPFVIPADRVLKKFAGIVEPICDHIVSFNIRNRNLRTTRDLLLPRLISGELDVADLNIDIGGDGDADSVEYNDADDSSGA
jgi:type I restriction enzyme, S subunit